MRVAIQGGNASFHDIAARNYFPKISKVINCDTFKEVFECLKNDKADVAVLAIENAIAGSILGNYTLMKDYGFPIIGEIKLKIIMNLMALPGQKIEDLKIVRSHYMALMQCAEFLEKYPHIKIEEGVDTADSARDIRAENQVGVGAIAGMYAAELYDLEVLAESIETFKQNYTRFMIIGKTPNEDSEELEKATLSFQLHNEVGSLSKVLSLFNEFDINMTKIQSLPRLGFPDEYTFYVDCDWKEYNDFKESIKKIKTMVSDLQVLGVYKKGDVFYGNSSSR
ncbi:MAG: hypothetical protein RLZZ175_2612 [Bacteroidota bacterium]|jgi:prephenate dehydratase